jgi:predicted DNA-binding transcriptional regulator YafY
MSEALLRHWVLLQAIPRHPRKIDVSALLDHLSSAGYRISKRSVQRDLNLLSTLFPLVHDDSSIPWGWSWDAKAPALDLPAMDGPTALTLTLLDRYAKSLLPPVLQTPLAPAVKRAEAVLRDSAPREYLRWKDVVRVVPREMPLLAPKVDPDVARTVYEALFEGKCLSVRYRSRSSEQLAGKDATVHPLGLVAQGNVIYLVATFWNFDDLRHLALHRISRAEKLDDQPAKTPKGFDLDRYLEGGAFQLPATTSTTLNGTAGKRIRVDLRFEAFTAQHLRETPISHDQVMTDEPDRRVRVGATVVDSERLVWWLLGFGGNVEVAGPKALRERIQVEIERARTLY